MTRGLRAGVLGLLCSNRFLSVQAGEALRDRLRREYEFCEIFDLGDTKLFAAAVLPAIVIARRRPTQVSSTCVYVRAYEYGGLEAPKTAAASILAALDEGDDGIIEVSGRRFEVERGELKYSASAKEPWRVANERRESWLATIARNTTATFADIGVIRVGIKTTADRVFIRSTWSDLPSELRPEQAPSSVADPSCCCSLACPGSRGCQQDRSVPACHLQREAVGSQPGRVSARSCVLRGTSRRTLVPHVCREGRT